MMEWYHISFLKVVFQFLSEHQKSKYTSFLFLYLFNKHLLSRSAFGICLNCLEDADEM